MRSLVAALACAVLAGCGGGGPRTLSGEGMLAYELSAASDGAHLAVAWNGGPEGENDIYLQALTADGAASGPLRRITDATGKEAYEVDLEFIDGDPLMAWYEKDTGGGLTAWLARTDGEGKIKWRQAIGAAGAKAKNPVVRIGGGAIHVAWIEDGGVWTRSFDGEGKTIDVPHRAADAGDTTWNLNAAVDAEGVFYVVYDAKLGTRASELQLLTVTSDHINQRQLSRDDGVASLYPDLVISPSGNVGLTWFDERDGNQEVYLATGKLSDLAAGKPLAEQRITHTKAASIGAYLSWNGERLGLAWCDAEPGQQEVYAQVFDASGKPAGEAKRLTNTKTESSIPSIRPWRRGFVVAWNEYQLGGGGHSVTASAAMVTLLP